MEQSPPEDLILDILQDARLGLSPLIPPERKEIIRKLTCYCRLWEKWNLKTSLTAEKEMDLFIRNHLFMSLQFSRAIGGSGGLADIGSGAGLPGIPLKIVLPDIPIILVECRRKRANFIRQVVRDLSLDSTVVIDSKVEQIQQPPFPIDTAVFRAVSDTASCLEMADGILEPEGRVILLRARDDDSADSPHPAYSHPGFIYIEDYEGNPLTLVSYQKN